MAGLRRGLTSSLALLLAVIVLQVRRTVRFVIVADGVTTGSLMGTVGVTVK